MSRAGGLRVREWRVNAAIGGTRPRFTPFRDATLLMEPSMLETFRSFFDPPITADPEQSTAKLAWVVRLRWVRSPPR